MEQPPLTQCLNLTPSKQSVDTVDWGRSLCTGAKISYIPLKSERRYGRLGSNTPKNFLYTTEKVNVDSVD